MNKILQHVKSEGSFFLPEWKGGCDELNFTADEYVEFSNNLANRLENKMIAIGGNFPTYIAVFEEEGTEFVLRLMIGQGSTLDLFTRESYEADWGKIEYSYEI